VSQSHKTLVLWVVLILMFLAIWQLVKTDETKEVAYSEFLRAVGETRHPPVPDRANRLESVHFNGEEIEYAVRPPKQGDQLAKLVAYVTEGPIDATEAHRLLDGLDIEIRHTRSWWAAPMAHLIPGILSVVLLFFLLLEFRLASPARRRKTNHLPTFDSIPVDAATKESLRDVVAFARGETSTSARQPVAPKTVLICGSDHAASITLARAVAGEANAHVEEVAMTENAGFPSSVTIALMRSAFDRALEQRRSVLVAADLHSVCGIALWDAPLSDDSMEPDDEPLRAALEELARDIEGASPERRVVFIATANPELPSRFAKLFTCKLDLDRSDPDVPFFTSR
jgi:cell division protease FtsH